MLHTITKALPTAYAHRYDDTPNAQTFEQRRGWCYRMALAGTMNLARHGGTAWLVHGTVGPNRNPHAWVLTTVSTPLLGDLLVAWDGVLDELYPAEVFAEPYPTGMHAMTWTTYTAVEAATMMLREGHHGPWGRWEARYDREIARMERERAVGKVCVECAHLMTSHAGDCPLGANNARALARVVARTSSSL